VTDAALERAAVRRVTWRLLPFLFLLFVVAFIDRTNVALAALQMNRDLRLGAAAYGLGAGVFSIGYALFEIPSNLILVRVGARRWIARIAITWGAIACAMALVRGPGSFFVLRFLLGVAEAGYVPGVIYYLGGWFPERHRARAMSRFMVGIPLSGVVGGPLGGALLALDGRLGLAGWQWLFLVEGLPAVALGAVALGWLTDHPDDARWLPAAERDWLRGRLDAERGGGAAPALGGGVREALTSGAVWWLSMPYTLAIVGGLGLTLWLPVLLRERLGASDQGVGLMLGGMGLAGVVGMLLNGAHSDRAGERVAHAAVPLAVTAIGFAVSATQRAPVLVVAGFALVVVGVNAFMPVFWTLPTAFLRRGVTAAAGIALINAVGNVGGFVGPGLLGLVKDATGSFDGALLALAGLAGVAALLMLRVRPGALSRVEPAA